MLQLLRYAKDYRKQIILGPFFKFLEAVFELIGLVNRRIALCVDLSVLCFDCLSGLRYGSAKSLDGENQQLLP